MIESAQCKNGRHPRGAPLACHLMRLLMTGLVLGSQWVATAIDTIERTASQPATTPAPSTDPRLPSPDQTDHQNPSPLLEELAEVLQQLEAAGLVDPGDPGVRRRLLAALLKAVPGSVAITTADPKPGDEPRTDLEDDTLRVSKPQDGIALFGLRTLNPATADALMTALADLPRTRAPRIILDLRGTDGRAYKQIAAVRDQLAERDPAMAILVDGGTTGAAELLALQLRPHAHRIALGQPTAGAPLPKRPIRLSTGDLLLLPDADTPGATRAWPPANLQPDVVIEAPRQPAKQAEDPVLRQALDLMIAVRALDGTNQDSPQ